MKANNVASLAKRKKKDRGAQFLRNNLELLGFGTRKDALVQAVKELFENALDATLSMSSDGSWDDAPLELLRIQVQANARTGFLDIVCADTGSGMRAHQIKVLCGNVFETTKANGASGERTSGKYGVGLKAAVLYSQLHADDACLKIATTSNSEEILYVQLRIDVDSEETAVVQKVTHFIVDEDHQCFSGTEMRLSVPCPEKITEVEDAADVLALYFQSLRYTVPPFLAVQFKFDVSGISTSVECQHLEEPIDRFIADLGASADDILYVYQEMKLYSVSCMALLMGNLELGHTSEIEICLLRYANHVPLISGESVFLCGITKGVSSNKLWKKYGLRCQRASSHLVNQLVASPLRASASLKEEDEDEPIRLVIAVDVCVTDSGSKGGLKYGSMSKSTLDSRYVEGVQACCQSVLQQLAEAGRLCTPKQFQDQDLVTNFAPLLANAVAAIANRAQMASRKNAKKIMCPDDQRAFDEGAILLKLQEVLLPNHQSA